MLPHRRFVAIVSAALASVVTLAGCGGGSSPGPVATATPSSPCGGLAPTSLAHAATFSVGPAPQPGSSGSVRPVLVKRALTSARGAATSSPSLLAVTYRPSEPASAQHIADVERSLGASGYDLATSSAVEATRVVRLGPGQSLESARAALAAAPGVVRVDTVGLRRTQGSPVVPNDPGFTQIDQWDLYKTQMPDAWCFTTGSPSIAIAMIDTGVDVKHPEFAQTGKLDCAHSEDIQNGVRTAGCPAVQDEDGHGTNTAGIAAADTNDGLGFAGVGWNVTLQIYKIFPNPVAPLYTADPNYAASTIDEAIAINDAVANGARVINLSLGAATPDTTEQTAIENAIAQGVVVVAAAGNESATALDYPAGYPGVISVGATGLDDTANPNSYAKAVEFFAPYSNTASNLTLSAPGGGVNTTTGIPATTDNDFLHYVNNLYSETIADPTQQCPAASQPDCVAGFVGTSQATPHVAGAAALMLSLNSTLTPAQIASILSATADSIGDSRAGAGRLDVYRALAAVP